MSSLALGLAVSRVSEGIIRFPSLQLPPYMRRIATCKTDVLSTGKTQQAKIIIFPESRKVIMRNWIDQLWSHIYLYCGPHLYMGTSPRTCVYFFGYVGRASCT